MTAAALIAALRARGVTLEPRGDRLRVRPISRLTPDELDRLRAAKAEVLALLAAAPVETTPAPASPAPSPRLASTAALAAARADARLAYAFPWPDRIPDLGARRVQPFDLCGDCGAGSWVTYGDRVCCLPCARRRAEVAGPGPGARRTTKAGGERL